MTARRRAEPGDSPERRDNGRRGTLEKLQSRIEQASDDPEDRLRRLKEMALEMIDEVRAVAAEKSGDEKP